MAVVWQINYYQNGSTIHSGCEGRQIIDSIDRWKREYAITSGLAGEVRSSAHNQSQIGSIIQLV